MLRKLATVVTLSALCLARVADAAIVWSEAGNGDISDDYLTPTSVTVLPGINSIIGSSVSVDREYLTFTVPTGFRLTAITLAAFNSTNDLAFMAISTGNTFSVSPAAAPGVSAVFSATRTSARGRSARPWATTPWCRWETGPGRSASCRRWMRAPTRCGSSRPTRRPWATSSTLLLPLCLSRRRGQCWALASQDCWPSCAGGGISWRNNKGQKTQPHRVLREAALFSRFQPPCAPWVLT